MSEQPKVIAFDVIETLFSLDRVKAEFVAAGLPEPASSLWLAAGLRDAFALAASDCYAPFTDVLGAALDEVGFVAGRRINEEQKTAILEAIPEMRVHDDVAPALTRLARAKIRMIALSNGSSSTTTPLIEGAGLEAAFERVLSTDGVGRSKPHPEVYLQAAQSTAVAPDQMMLIAAHPWDIHGAKAAGLMAGYVDRGKPYPDFMQQPDFADQSLDGLVERILAS